MQNLAAILVDPEIALAPQSLGGDRRLGSGRSFTSVTGLDARVADPSAQTVADTLTATELSRMFSPRLPFRLITRLSAPARV